MCFYFLTFSLLLASLISCEMIVKNVTENGQNLEVIAVEPQENLQIVRLLKNSKTKICQFSTLQALNISNRNEKDLRSVSSLFLSNQVQSAIMNAINKGLHEENSQDVKKIQEGILKSFQKIRNESYIPNSLENTEKTAEKSYH